MPQGVRSSGSLYSKKASWRWSSILRPDEAKIYTSWITKKLRETIAIGSIKEIRIESRKQEVENPDAVEFVEKISAQHGTVIPGFGEEKVLFLLKLHLSDGTERIIYSDDSMQDVMSAHDEIKEFLREILH